MLILTVIRVLIDSVVRPQNNSALECPCCLDYLRLCCNSPFNLLCFKIGECGKCLMKSWSSLCCSHGKLSLRTDHHLSEIICRCDTRSVRRRRETRQDVKNNQTGWNEAGGSHRDRNITNKKLNSAEICILFVSVLVQKLSCQSETSWSCQERRHRNLQILYIIYIIY